MHNKLLTYQDKRYRYDAFGRMIEKRSAKRGLQRFAYDATGRIIASQDSLHGQRETFTYDAESRLIEVRNDNGSVVKMTYDPLGLFLEKERIFLEISTHPKSIERDLSSLFEWIRSCTRISIHDEDGEQSGW